MIMAIRIAMARLTTVADIMSREAKQPRTRVRIFIRAAVAVSIGTWLSLQIGTNALATLAARSLDPRLLAITGSGTQPQAGAVYADMLFAGKNYREAADLARSVVIADPSNDRAVRVLGLALEKTGDTGRGNAIMRHAAVLGWRDTQTQLWIMYDAAIHNDVVTVMRRADGLARRNAAGNLTRPIFLAAVTDPTLRAAFADRLAQKPTWRAAFFADVRQYLPATSAAGMEALFSEMRAKGDSISPIEWLSYISRLADLGQVRRARSIWGQVFHIPASRLTAAPYDGNFALTAARTPDTPIGPFEWAIDPDLVGAVTFGADGASIPADLVGGKIIASQTLVLAPGKHILSAKIGGSPAAAAAGWIISCLPSKMELQRQLPPGGDDELSNVAFVVPEDGCDAQRLALISRDRPGAQSVTISNVRVH